MMNQHLIQTGRTTRQFMHAIALAQIGNRVTYIVGSDAAARDMLRYSCARFGKDAGFVSIANIQQLDFDWETMKPRDWTHSANHIWIVDHTVVEREYMNIGAKIAHLQLIQTQLYPLTTGMLAPVHPAADQRQPPGEDHAG